MEAAQVKQSTPMSSPKVAFGSPKFRNRMEEKEELQNLNDRFAVYIDKIRQLEDRNSSLAKEVALRKEDAQLKESEMKTLYEGELQNTRQLLDEICKEKSRIELENSKSSAHINDLQKKLESDQQELKRFSDKNLYLEKKVNDSEATIATLRSEQRTLKEQYAQISTEHKSLQGVHDATNQQLEERTLEKVNLENQIQTLTEDLDFRNRAHEQEVSKLKEEIESLLGTTVTVTDFKEQYDSALKTKLQELRDEFEEEAEHIKRDVDNAYKLKIDDLQTNCTKLRDECGSQLVIIRDLRSSLETLKVEKNVLESEVNSLKKHIEELDQLRAVERDDYAKHLQDKEYEIKESNRKTDDLHKEYEELMGVKVALDLEINAYRKLLEGEEQRLNITPPLPRGRKRRRSDSDVSEPPVISTAKGTVHIVQCDASGKFIKIKNTGSTEEPLGGWLLRRVSDGKEPVEFKFNPRSILKGDATVCVWSSSSGTKHKPPTDLVMKSHDWGSGTNSVTTLHNSEGDVVAQLTESSRSKSRKRPESGNDSCVVS